MATLGNTLGTALGSALVGGLMGGFAVSQLVSKGEDIPKHAEVTEDNDAPAEDATALGVRIAELESRLGRMEQQLRSADALRDYARTLAKSEGTAGVERGGGTAPAPTVNDAEDPVFELAVRSVLDRVDWEREEEERVTRAQQRSERAERQTALLTQRLSLSPEQSEAVALALNRQMERFRELRDAKGEARPATREDWRQRTGTIRAETDKALGEVLDEEQMKGYRAFAEEEGLGPRDWGFSGRNARPDPSAAP
jgi:hypothetical protein